MDSGILSRILDDIRDYGGDYVIDEFDVGHEAHDPSSARITVEADGRRLAPTPVDALQTRGVNQLEPGRGRDRILPSGRRLPDGFYSTTNLETRVRIDGAGSTWRIPRWTAAWSSRSHRRGRPAGADGADVRRHAGACSIVVGAPASR